MAIMAACGLGAGAALVFPQPWTAFSPVPSARAQQQRSGAGDHGSSGHGGGAVGQPGGSSGAGKTGGVGGQFGAGSQSQGPGGGGRSSFGYWGGRHVPEGPGDNLGEPPGAGTDDGQTPADQASDGSTTGHGAANLGGTVGELHCNGIGAGSAGGEKRMSEENLKRLLIVRAMLEKQRSSKVPPAYSGGVVNLARFQAELERTHPNLTLAGMYLGRVADVPVTASVVETASSALCVPLRTDMASAVAGVAEAQRQALSKARNQPAAAKP